jgi:curved DNA-binding protein CbpA
MDDELLSAYQTLDLHPSAPLEEVRASYRDLMKVWHPDRYQQESERLRRRAEEQVKRITRAYDRILEGAAQEPHATPILMDFGARWGFIDESGQTLIPPQFDEARPFNAGLAAVRIDDKWGFVNPRGDLQVTPLYEECSDFSEGLSAVRWYGRWGFIDTSGAFVIMPKFQEAESFQNGSAKIRLGARRARVNRQGEVHFDPTASGYHLEE